MGLYGVIQGACGAIEAYGISIGISKVGYKIWCVYIVYNMLQLVGKSSLCIEKPRRKLILDSIVLRIPGNQQAQLGGNRCRVRNAWRGACQDVARHSKGKEGEGEARQRSGCYQLSMVEPTCGLHKDRRARRGRCGQSASMWGTLASTYLTTPSFAVPTQCTCSSSTTAFFSTL